MVIVGLVLSAVLWFASVPWAEADELSTFLAKYGRPDVDDSTQHDQPRPPIVTRWLIYRKARVKVFFIPDAKVFDAPPYRGWKYFGAIDDGTKEKLSAEEVIRRLKK